MKLKLTTEIEMTKQTKNSITWSLKNLPQKQKTNKKTQWVNDESKEEIKRYLKKMTMKRYHIKIYRMQ